MRNMHTLILNTMQKPADQDPHCLSCTNNEVAPLVRNKYTIKQGDSDSEVIIKCFGISRSYSY